MKWSMTSDISVLTIGTNYSEISKDAKWNPCVIGNKRMEYYSVIWKDFHIATIKKKAIAR